MTEAEVLEYLTLGSNAYQKYDQWLSYNLGSRFVEVLVALKGTEVILPIFSEMAAGATYEQAFAKAFGVEWSKAMPIIAKAVAANIADGR